MKFGAAKGGGEGAGVVLDWSGGITFAITTITIIVNKIPIKNPVNQFII